MNNKKQDRETLLYILYSYKIAIERGGEIPAVTLDDVLKSINYVLRRNDYGEKEYNAHRGARTWTPTI